LNICHVVAVVTMKECLSLFTSFKVLAVHAFTIFRTKNIGLEAFTVLFETSRFLAVASLIVLYKHQSIPSFFLQLFPTISYDGQQHQKTVLSHKKKELNWIPSKGNSFKFNSNKQEEINYYLCVYHNGVVLIF
jgi:hypothetical protein